MRNINKVIGIVLVLAFGYLFTSFVCMEFDITEWHGLARFIFAVYSVILVLKITFDID